MRWRDLGWFIALQALVMTLDIVAAMFGHFASPDKVTRDTVIICAFLILMAIREGKQDA